VFGASSIEPLLKTLRVEEDMPLEAQSVSICVVDAFDFIWFGFGFGVFGVQGAECRVQGAGFRGS
jgi:hypothetical protein